MKIQYQSPTLSIFESALYRTTTTLVTTKDFLLLVDPNWLPIEIDFIRQQVKKQQGDRPLYLLFTHSDYDHIIALRAFPQAIVIQSKRAEENPDKEKQLQLIREFDDENYILRDYPIAYPTGDILIEQDGQQQQIGDSTLTFYLAPGHTADGLFTIIDSLNIWIAGDYLCNVEFPFIYDSSSAYLQTLEKAQHILQTHQPNVLIPGHGDATSDPQEMAQRIEQARQYIQAVRTAILQNQPLDLEPILQQYDFPLGLAKAHRNNVKKIKEELLGA